MKTKQELKAAALNFFKAGATPDSAFLGYSESESVYIAIEISYLRFMDVNKYGTQEANR